MPHLPFHQEQLEFMIRLASYRPVFLDPFFRVLNYFDSVYFFLVLIPTLWIGCSYRWGIRIFYWFTLASLVVNFAKNSIGWPRPSTDFPEIGMYHPKSFGFPSGGAMTALFLGILFIYYVRTKTAWIIGLIYILLLSFSRIYLGVHYPLDVLGGWVIAVILASAFILVKEPLERFLKKKGSAFTLIISIAIPLLIMAAFRKNGVWFVMGSTLGIGIGVHISLKYQLFLPDAKTFSEGALRAVIGTFFVFALAFFLPGSFSYIKSFCIALLMSTLASPACKWIMRSKIS